MSSSELRLRVRAADQSAELFVLDRTFTIVASGLGHLDATLSHGLYKLRLRLGTTLSEAHLALDGEASRLIGAPPEVSLSARPDAVDVDFGEIEFASPVPLRATTRIHEYHFDNAARISAHTTRELGSGGKLFVFSRAWSAAAERGRFSGWDPMADLSLHDGNGALLCRLSEAGVSDRSGDPWAGCNLALTPGSYRLRREGMNVLEMPLFVPEGWQLQVFLLASSVDRSKSPVIDFGRAAVLLSRRPFDHSDPAWRLTEQARQGLSLQRSVVRREDLQQMFFIKFDSPMLGIYGAQLLIANDDNPDASLLAEVVRNLRKLVGPHPDVEALALSCGLKPDHPEVFRCPPMLVASWEIIVRSSAAHPELVPPTSASAWVAPRLWTSGGPWLMWSPADVARATKPDPLFQEELSPSEAKVWEYWRSQVPAQPRATVPARPTKLKVAAKTVVNELSLPASVVTDAAASLARRLTTTEIPNNSYRDRYAAKAISMMTGSVAVALSDEALLAQAREGEVDAFANLVKRYEASVRRFVQQIVRDHDEAEDVTQDVFFRAYNRLRHLPQSVKPSTWLYAIARNVARERTFRSRRLERLKALADESNVPDPPSVSGTPTLQQAFGLALDKLSPDERTVLALRLVYELPYSDIAEIVESPEVDVRRTLRVITLKLREQLADVEPTPGTTMSDLRVLALENVQRAATKIDPDISSRVAARIRGAAPLVRKEPERVVLQARHSTYRGASRPWRPMSSRFAGRRLPEPDERNRSRAPSTRLLVESDSEEELHYEVVEENILDLSPEADSEVIVIYVALVSGDQGHVAGFATDYRGPYHTMGFASKIEDRSLMFTLVLENEIARIRCAQLELSEPIEGVQRMRIPPGEATYELDVDFRNDDD